MKKNIKNKIIKNSMESPIDYHNLVSKSGNWHIIRLLSMFPGTELAYSNRTAEYHIVNLKKIFQVKTLQELREKVQKQYL